MKIGSRRVEISSPAKVLFPDPGITKLELVEYVAAVADVMLPHLRDRPLSVQRYPAGIESKGFFQKAASDHFPEWVHRVTVPKEKGTVTHPVADNAATLVYLANQNVVTHHVWTARADRPRHPDRLVFDLDPSDDDDFPLIIDTARELRLLLDELGLRSFVATTGSRGLHVVVPLDRSADVDEVHGFSAAVATKLAERDPDRLTVEFYKAERKGRLYLDVARNGYAQTVVAPYSVRARPGAPVATPLEWEELDDAELGPGLYTIANVLDRLERTGDPWAGIGRSGRSLRRAQTRLSDA